MLNSKFGLRQAANVVSATGDQLGNLTTNINSQQPNHSQSSTNESFVIAKYDYQSQGPQELSIRKGDRLLLIDDSRHWWKVLSTENLTGFVPSNYVKREKQSLFDSIRRGIRVNTKTKKSTLATNNQSPSSSPLISKCSQNDITTISPAHEQQFSFKKPYSNNSNNDCGDNLSFSNLTNKQTQSNSDILVRELGPNFNGNLPPLNTNNKKNDTTHFGGNNNNDLMSLQHDDRSLLLKTLITTTATVKYNYKSQQPDELSLIKGAKISVLEKSDDGWWKGELSGKVGWFPSNYVLEQPTNNDMNNGQHRQNNEQKLNSLNETVQSKQDTASNSYSMNSATNRLSQCNDFNKPFTDKSAIPHGANQFNDDDENPQVLFVVVALYSFQSQNSEELSFAKDERLDIIEKPANDPDWWRACNQLGETGLVPKNYVQIVPTMKSIRSWSAKSPVKKSFDSANMLGPEFGKPITASNLLSSTEQQQTTALTTSSLVEQSENVLTKQSSLLSSSVDGDRNLIGGNTSANNHGSLAQLAHELEIKLKLNDKNWYHGVMSRQQCDQLLNAYAEDGDFLIRNSETNAGDFSVSLKAPIRNKHFRVHYADDSFCIGQRKFNSLDELVEHYKRTPIYTSAMGEKMFLKKAYCR